MVSWLLVKPVKWRFIDVSERIDLRGLNCPEPVIKTKRLFDNSAVQRVEALVDDEVCVANLERLARSLKAGVSSSAEDGYFLVVLDRDPAAVKIETEGRVATELATERGQRQLTVIFLTKDTFGEGDRDFSRTLLNVFLQTLWESGHRPRAVLMANSGVKLLAKGAPTIKVLQDFRESGSEVLACGLCVDYYGLKDDIPTDQIVNMFAICEYLAAADNVISP